MESNFILLKGVKEAKLVEVKEEH
ncbi:uncharacterized protein G2W53_039786 [Senna tora]|uniref:Uncharacterized protein n=1 Tax=Senna tora TaxID=362788 RepID=A0A834SNB5_9FABA|nr:uncharacterized protein G2W53_039786 [Senna tora]